VELSNSIQSRREVRKVIIEVFKATLRINLEFQLGIKSKKADPIKGNNKTSKSNDI